MQLARSLLSRSSLPENVHVTKSTPHGPRARSFSDSMGVVPRAGGRRLDRGGAAERRGRARFHRARSKASATLAQGRRADRPGRRLHRPGQRPAQLRRSARGNRRFGRPNGSRWPTHTLVGLGGRPRQCRTLRHFDAIRTGVGRATNCNESPSVRVGGTLGRTPRSAALDERFQLGFGVRGLRLSQAGTRKSPSNTQAGD